MSKIEDQRHPSYVKYPLADILIIVMCAVLCGLDTLGDLVIYAKNKKDFLAKEFGIEEIPSKATFARVLSAVNGKEIGDAILDILRVRFGVSGEVIAVDGKAICSTAKPGNPHSALQILSAYMPDNGVVLAQEAIHQKTNEIPDLRLRHFPEAAYANLPWHSTRISLPLTIQNLLLRPYAFRSFGFRSLAVHSPLFMRRAWAL